MAGRPKGQPKTGGRQKGTPNKETQKLDEMRAAAEDDGMSPLDFFKMVYRDPSLEYGIRMRAATEAAKYCHPTFQAIAVTTQNEHNFNIRSDEQIGRTLAHLLTVQSNEPRQIEGK